MQGGGGGTKQCGQRKAKEYTGHTELKKNKQEGVCSAVEGKNSSAGPAKEEMRGRGMRPQSNGGEGEREKERDSTPPLCPPKETNGPMVRPHQQMPAATVDRDGKRNLVSGEKKKRSLI